MAAVNSEYRIMKASQKPRIIMFLLMPSPRGHGAARVRSRRNDAVAVMARESFTPRVLLDTATHNLYKVGTVQPPFIAYRVNGTWLIVSAVCKPIVWFPWSVACGK